MIERLRRRLGAGWRASPPSYEMTSAALEVDAMMASLRVDPRMRRVVGEARRVLGVDREVEVHPTGERLAAAHTADGGPLIISLHWRALSGVDDDALLAVVGHELGHHLAHSGAQPDAPDPFFVYAWLHADRRSEIRETAAAYSRAAELTADRFALLACQDLDALLRLLAALSDEAPGMDAAPFLAACKDRVREVLARRQRAGGDSHPEIPVRAFAAWLFSQSDVYRRLTGRGTGSRPLLDIDMELARLVGPNEDLGPPVDEPTWMDGVGEAIYAQSSALGKALGDSAAKLGAALGNARRPPPPQRSEEPLEDAGDSGDEPEMDDLEARFAALEREMGERH
jgi:hypothetical protein